MTSREIKDLGKHLARPQLWPEIELVLHGALKNDRGNPRILALLGDAALQRRDVKLASTYYQLAKQLFEGQLGVKPAWERPALQKMIDDISRCEAACRAVEAMPDQTIPIFTGTHATTADSDPNFSDRMLDVTFCGLKITQDNYISAAKNYLARKNLTGAQLGVYAAGAHADAVLRSFEASELSDSIHGFILGDDAANKDLSWPKFKNRETFKPRVTLVHMAEGQDEASFIRDCAARGLLRRFRHNFDGPHTVVLLNGSIEEAKLRELDHPYPILLRTTAYAARTRFIPTFQKLSEYVGRHVQSPNAFRDAERQKRLVHRTAPIDTDLAAYYAIMNLEYYDILELHSSSLAWDLLRTDDMVRAIMLVRDPRDMCVSACMQRINAEGQGSGLETYLNDWLRQVARTIVDEMAAAKAYGAWLHRFEDLMTDERGAWERLLVWLGWRERISDEQLDDALYLGSYEYQSGGKRQRGESDTFLKYSGTGSYLRKGISGDWKNHFTDANKTLCKELIGQELIELGYEQSLDW